MRSPRLLAASLTISLMVLSGRAWALDSAQDALDILWQKLPDTSSVRLLAIIGFEGDTEPSSWHFWLHQQEGADAPVLEYSVTDGDLYGPRPVDKEELPVESLSPIPFGSFRIDSHEVAQIADDELILEGLEVDRLDYSLRVRGEARRPIWMATLLNPESSTLGHLFIEAETGDTTHIDLYHELPPLPELAEDESSAEEEAADVLVARPIPAAQPAEESRRTISEVLGVPSPIFKRSNGKPMTRERSLRLFQRRKKQQAILEE